MGAVAGSVFSSEFSSPQFRVCIAGIRFQFGHSPRMSEPAEFRAWSWGPRVNQVSSYVDEILRAFSLRDRLRSGYAQTLYLLPVSLFGMAISNAELPEWQASRTGQ